MDPTLWKSPEVFDPTRFLEDDGLTCKEKPKFLIPFSTGKRMCPGEPLASVEIFLYLTSILQKFRVLPEEGKSIDFTVRCVTFNIPRLQKLRFIPRV